MLTANQVGVIYISLENGQTEREKYIVLTYYCYVMNKDFRRS